MNLSGSRGSSELRILLLGPKNAEKSLSGNIILGKKVFDMKSLQCVEEHSEIVGMKITVVDTPGWWGNLPFEENPVLYRQENVLSVTKCPPGPHALLLVLHMDTEFNLYEREVLCDNMKHFGEEVWRHTVVLFTCENQSADSTTQLSENENLQWLIRKCGNRYHVLNTKNWGDGSQVTELLEKIQKMVEDNRGSYYEINRDTLQRVEEERREQEKRAEERKIINQHLRDETRTGNKHALSELRMVLLCYNGSGKSSAGNTILGKSAFDCKRSLTSAVREGDVAGRHITVVDTPGRKRNYYSKYTPRLYKDEIVLSSSHCPPGPHVFLLVIRVDVSFTEVYRKAVEEHVALLGLKIWDHMIVLFTFGDWLKDTSIELFIESEGEALQWIVDKCGNRYHVFNNKSTDDGHQVTELFEKIEELVAENKGSYFMVDRQILRTVKNRRVQVEKRAKQMKNELQKKLRPLISGNAELSEMTLVLLGPHYSGKSSTGNIILGRQAFDRRVKGNVKENVEVAGRKLNVVCTSGFEKDYLTGKRLEDAKLNILRSVTEQSSGTHAFILVQSVHSSFADEEKSALEKIMEPLGEGVWKHMLVLFAAGDELGETPIELFIASEGGALQWLTEKCGNRYHVLNNKNWGDGSQATELLEKIDEMVAENKGRPYEIDRETLQHVEEEMREQEKRRMKNQQQEYEMDKETLEQVEGTVLVPIKGAQSMDDPVNIAEKDTFTSGIGSAYLSDRSREAPEESSSKRSSGVESSSRRSSGVESSSRRSSGVESSSRRSSGVESLGSIPELD